MADEGGAGGQRELLWNKKRVNKEKRDGNLRKEKRTDRKN